MKTLNVVFTDEEYMDLVLIKSQMNMNWHDFFIAVSVLGKEGKIDKA